MLKTTFFVLAALLASSPVASAITVVGPFPGVDTVYVGSPVSIDILYYSTTSAISGFDMAVQYPSFLTYVSASEAGFFAINGVLGLSPDSTSLPPFYLNLGQTVIDLPGYILNLFDAATTADTDPIPAALFTLNFLVNRTGSGSVTAVCDGPNDCTDFPMLSDPNSNAVPVDGTNSVTLNALDAPPPAPVPEPAFGLPVAGAALLLLWRKKLTGSPRA